MHHISTAENLMLYDLCNQILEIDKCIRFAGFTNNMGAIIAAHRGVLMSVEKEEEQSLLDSEVYHS